MPSCSPCRTLGTRWSPSKRPSNKKDIYGEKPLARTIAEQQAIVKAVQKNKRIWQTGSWQRSQAPFRKAAEIVRNGLIGKVTRVEVGLPGGQTTLPAPPLPCWRSCPVRPRTRIPGQGRARQPGLGVAVTPPPPDSITTCGSAPPDGALHPGPRPHELALELQHRRRPVARLDRPPLRHRPLGPRTSTTPAPPKSKATASSRPTTPSGTPAPNTASPSSTPRTSP